MPIPPLQRIGFSKGAYTDPRTRPPAIAGFVTIWDAAHSQWVYQQANSVAVVQSQPLPIASTSLIDTATNFIQTNPLLSLAIAGGALYFLTKK